MPCFEHIILIGSTDPKILPKSKNSPRLCFSLITAMRVLQARGLTYAVAKDAIREAVKTKELVKVQSGFEMIEIHDQTSEHHAYLSDEELRALSKEWHGKPHYIDFRVS